MSLHTALSISSSSSLRSSSDVLEHRLVQKAKKSREMEEDKGQLDDDQPPAHPPPKPPSSSDELQMSVPPQPMASKTAEATAAFADLPPKGFVRKTSMPLEQQSSWRRNPVKRRKKTLDENISHKIKLEAAEAAAVAAAAAATYASKADAVDNPKTFKSAVGRHSLVIKRTPGADNEKLIAASATSKKSPKEKHRRSKSETKLPIKASVFCF